MIAPTASICPSCGGAYQRRDARSPDDVCPACELACWVPVSSPRGREAARAAREEVVADAQERCRRYRRRILEISEQVEAAHVAPAFSCLEIVDALYHKAMRRQDIFIMSKGHGCLAQYVVLEDIKWEHERECKTCGGATPTSYDAVCPDCINGYSGPRALDSYCAFGGVLGAHPDYAPELGIHASTGSLGHGLGIAAGQALAERMRGSDVRVYVLLSDGECQEGSTWEAALVAANLGLSNLIVLVDCNDFGGMERMSEVHRAFHPLVDKFNTFGCWAGVEEVDGHDFAAVVRAVRGLDPDPTCGPPVEGPGVVICRTTKGRGVSFMENNPLFHYRSPSKEELARAVEEIG